MSLEAVAYLADVDVSTVSRIERGLVEPRRPTVVAMASAFGVSVRRMRVLLDQMDGSGMANAVAAQNENEPAGSRLELTTSRRVGGGDDDTA